MDREILINTFDPAIEQKFESGFQELINRRVAFYNGLIQFLSELQGKEEVYLLEQGLPRLFQDFFEGSVAQQPQDFTNNYLNVLSEVARELPEEVVWSRKFPLRREVRSILADPELVIELLREFKREQLQFFISLEQVLTAQVISGKKKNSPPDLSVLISALREQVNFLEKTFREKLDRAVERIQSRVHIGIEKKLAKKRGKAAAEEELAKQWEALHKTLSDEEMKWNEPKRLLIDRSKTILDFLLMKKTLQKESKKFLRNVDQSLQQLIIGPLQKFHKQLKGAVAGINQMEIYDSRKKIEQARRQLLASLKKMLDGSLRQAAEERVFARKAEQFCEEMLMRINRAPEKMEFVFNLTDNEPLSADDLKQAEWRLLLARIFREQLINRVKPANQQYDNFIAKITGEVQEIREILDVNLTAALEASENSGEQDRTPGQVSTEALARMIKRTGALISTVQQELDDIAASVKNGQSAFFEAVVTCFKADTANELHLFTAKYKIRETTRGWQDAVDTKTRESKDRLNAWYRLGRKKVVTYGNKVKTFLGYGEPETTESKRADIIGYLSETDQKLQELPHIYRRLFDFDAAVDPRFYIPVTDSSAAFKRAGEQWKSSLSAAFAVVGEKGSGKSAFLNLMAGELPGEESLYRLSVDQTIRSEGDLLSLLCRELDLQPAESADSLIKALQNEKGRRIVFLESVQNCFVRNINGYEAIEKLCYLISETRDHVFWVVSCSRYGWHFLDEVLSLSEYFSHIVHTDTLDASQTEKVIMSRHRASGYMLHFEPEQEVQKSRSSRELTEEEKQQNLKENYFKKLAEIADGNASIAILFWIRSIRSFDDSCFYIKPLEITSVEMIEELSSKVLFALAAVVMHDAVTDEDLSLILNLRREESRLMLNRLTSRGLLLRNGEQHMLNHLMYRQIIRVLRERNIIHLV